MIDDRPNPLTRRQALRQILAASLASPFAARLAGLRPEILPSSSIATSSTMPILSTEDDQFLNDVEKASFQFFWEQGNPKTGTVKDRCNSTSPTAKSIVQYRGYWIRTDSSLHWRSARLRRQRSGTRARLRYSALSLEKLPHHRGFFYHFADGDTGERMFDSEVSSVDTTILLCGVLTCRQHFRHPAVAQLANLIFNRVDWTWLSEEPPS